MLIRDIMTTNVVTMPSTTSLADARNIMDVHKVKRLPVVDVGKLVGIVTKHDLDKAGPSELTTFSKHELTYLVNTVTVKEFMSRNLLIISPDATIEEAVSLALRNQTRAFIVLKDSELVGIVTTYDFFVKVLGAMVRINQWYDTVLTH